MMDAGVPGAPREAMHVVARVGTQRLAFRVIDVEEAIDAPRLLPVMNAPSGLTGQFAHRDRTVSAFDAGWMFGLERATSAGTALVLRVSDDRIGLLVDDVDDLAAIDPAHVRPVPAGIDPGQLLAGVWVPTAVAGGATRVASASGEAPGGDSLVCLVNAVAVMSRGASVVAPAMPRAAAAVGA